MRRGAPGSKVEVIRLKKVAWVMAAVLAVAACSSVKNVVVKDIPLEEQERIMKEYKDRTAWTRLAIADMGDGGSVPRDEKVTIADLDLHFNGAVTIRTLKRKNMIVHGLELERPLNKPKIDAKLADLFWFDDPTTRHVASRSLMSSTTSLPTCRSR